MFGIVNLPAFIAAGILLNLTPGADTVYILGRSITQGRKAGICSALGIVSGVCMHITLAALGLSIIVARSAVAFDLIKYAGALYLSYLGLKMWVTKAVSELAIKPLNNQSLRRIYISGILTNALNPKVALFFLVFLPQFIAPGATSDPLPYFILGVIFLIPGTIWCLFLAIFSSKLADKIRLNQSVSTWLNRITGGIFIGLGVKLALLVNR